MITITKNKFHIILTLSAYIMPTLAMKPTVSYLELFPGKGKQSVLLPAPYKSLTIDEKKKMKFVKEGNVTTLRERDDCAFVGPLNPCQLNALHLGNTTVVGHISCNSDKLSLLKIARENFETYEPDVSLSNITGTIFTTHNVEYEQPYVKIGECIFSLKNLYEGRTQLEELKHSKDAVIKEFGIEDRTQIDAAKFTSKVEDFELGNYEFAELYIFLKHNSEQRPSLFSTCPMAESVLGSFDHLPIQKRLVAFKRALAQTTSSNAYFKQFAIGEATFVYGKYPFVQI